MKCLDHIDMAVMAGAVATVAGAAVLFGYLGVDRGPLMPPEPVTGATWLQQEMEQAINEAVVVPARVMDEQGRTQAALGRAIVSLAAARERFAGFVFDPMTMPAPHALPQPDLGRLIVAGSLARGAEVRQAEGRYGLAVRDAIGADRLAAGEPAASQATMIAAAHVLEDVAKQTAPAPAADVTREPAWGFGSIGDGTFLPMVVLVCGGGWLLVVAATRGMMERGPSTRTVSTHCEVHDKDLMVEMLLSDDSPYEVVHCSAFNGGPVTCDTRCLCRPSAQMAKAA
jgi:hypothetical protein